MPPSKVCPKCETIVPIRLKVCKSCQHVFRAKRKAEHHLPDKATKRMRVLQSDSVKSAMKAKGKLQKASKRASEQTVHRREKDRSNKASTRASETSEQTVHRPHLHGEKTPLLSYISHSRLAAARGTHSCLPQRCMPGVSRQDSYTHNNATHRPGNQ